MPKNKYYAYIVPGGARGVADSWAETERVVKGKSGARYRGFSDKEDAEAWLAQGASYEAKPPAPKLARGIYFDAGTGRGRGVEISVTDEKGKNLLHKALSEKDLNRFGKHFLGNRSATNNYGELMALHYALLIAKKLKTKKVFGDSKVVIDYWSKHRIKRKALPRETVSLADKVTKLREAFEKRGGAVKRISGGHNPADLGFHR